jgi:phosphatidylserine decarboxylase
MIPLTRHGWREMVVGTLLLAAGGWGLWMLYPPLVMLAVAVWVWLIAFFRDPLRKLPADPKAVVSPADGMVSDITNIEFDELLGGPAVRVGIFLSVFNVHINRSPCDGVVVATKYKPGKFINAMRHNDASTQNESNTIVIADAVSRRPIAVVRQIVGLIARRIVCTARENDRLTRGQRIGMIKFGSRTELYLPMWLAPRIDVHIGQSVRGAADVIATVTATEFAESAGHSPSSPSPCTRGEGSAASAEQAAAPPPEVSA